MWMERDENKKKKKQNQQTAGGASESAAVGDERDGKQRETSESAVDESNQSV